MFLSSFLSNLHQVILYIEDVDLNTPTLTERAAFRVILYIEDVDLNAYSIKK